VLIATSYALLVLIFTYCIHKSVAERANQLHRYYTMYPTHSADERNQNSGTAFHRAENIFLCACHKISRYRNISIKSYKS
jgi:hypothetical protein